MFVVHPFLLVPVLLVPLAAATAVRPRPPRRRSPASWRWRCARPGCSAGQPGRLQRLQGDLRTRCTCPDSRVLARAHLAARRCIPLLDDFTERVDTDVSNDMLGLLNLPGPPQTFGLYRDGNRIAALPKPGLLDSALRPGARLPRCPTLLLPGCPRAAGRLLRRVPRRRGAGAGRAGRDRAGAGPGGARGAAHGLGGSPPLAPDPRLVHDLGGRALAAARSGHGYDLVDLSADFLDAAEANGTAYTAEALTADLAAARSPGGIVSIPVSIREFPVYALRVLATARQALLASRHRRPGAARRRLPLRLERPHPAVPDAVERGAHRRRAKPGATHARSTCRTTPASTSRRRGRHLQRPAGGVVRRWRRHLGAGLGGRDRRRGRCGAATAKPTASAEAAFSLAPATLDRPAYYDVLRLDHLGTILRRLEILPQAEIGQLVNLAVLAQAVVIALLVLLVPLLAGKRLRAAGPCDGVRPVIYFAVPGPRLPVHRDRDDRARQPVPQRPHRRLRHRADGDAGVLRARQPARGPGRAGRHRAGDRDGRGCGAGPPMPGCCRRCWRRWTGRWTVRAMLVVLALAPVSMALGHAVPARPGAHRVRADAAVRLGGERRVQCGRHATGQPARHPGAGCTGFYSGAGLLYAICFIAYPSVRKRVQWQPSPT